MTCFPPSGFTKAHGATLLTNTSVTLPANTSSYTVVAISASLASPILLTHPAGTDGLLAYDGHSVTFDLDKGKAQLDTMPTITVPATAKAYLTYTTIG
jgi:hypothetical protein